MNTQDRAQYTEAIQSLDAEIARMAAEAGKDDKAFDTVTAPLVAQIGLVGKALLLLSNLLLDLAPTPAAAQSLIPQQCSFCTRPANPNLPTADWPMCTRCYNENGAFDPVLDGAALEIAEALQ